MNAKFKVAILAVILAIVGCKEAKIKLYPERNINICQNLTYNAVNKVADIKYPEGRDVVLYIAHEECKRVINNRIEQNLYVGEKFEVVREQGKFIEPEKPKHGVEVVEVALPAIRGLAATHADKLAAMGEMEAKAYAKKVNELISQQ